MKPSRNVAELDDAEALELVFNHYDLKWPTGYGNRVINCPVHDDRHASASVNTSSGLWQCFACQSGGDAYNLIMQKEGVSFVGAVDILRELADKSGRAVRRRTDRQSSGLIPSRSGDRRGDRRYVPSWLRK